MHQHVCQYNKVLKDGELVGISTNPGYSYYFRKMLSLTWIDLARTAVGTEVTVIWGEPGHRQKEIRATVAPAPYKKDNRRIRTSTGCPEHIRESITRTRRKGAKWQSRKHHPRMDERQMGSPRMELHRSAGARHQPHADGYRRLGQVLRRSVRPGEKGDGRVEHHRHAEEAHRRLPGEEPPRHLRGGHVRPHQLPAQVGLHLRDESDTAPKGYLDNPDWPKAARSSRNWASCRRSRSSTTPGTAP